MYNLAFYLRLVLLVPHSGHQNSITAAMLLDYKLLDNFHWKSHSKDSLPDMTESIPQLTVTCRNIWPQRRSLMGLPVYSYFPCTDRICRPSCLMLTLTSSNVTHSLACANFWWHFFSSYSTVGRKEILSFYFSSKITRIPNSWTGPPHRRGPPFLSPRGFFDCQLEESYTTCIP